MSDEQQQQPQFALQHIYLKDVSLEMPEGSSIFKQQQRPKISIDLKTQPTNLGNNQYEVVLTLTITSSIEEKTMHLLEIHQAGIFLIAGFDDRLEHTLNVICPSLIFPYAREAIDSMMVRSTLPPLMLAPVNFEHLFQQKLAQKQQKADDAPPAPEQVN